jgi:hypothetical protein
LLAKLIALAASAQLALLASLLSSSESQDAHARVLATQHACYTSGTNKGEVGASFALVRKI